MPQSRVYTNKDLIGQTHPPDILDDGDVNDVMDSPPDVLDDDETPQGDNYKGPDTWMEGFQNSFDSGDALDAGLRGLKGFAKGAILDIPETLYEGGKQAFNMATNPVGTFINNLKGIPEQAANIRHTITHAGSEPEEFGEMMGVATGQPLVTAGLAKGAPGAVRTAGKVLEPTGRVMKRYTPLTGMPVVSPFAGRNLMRLERLAGRGIESVGKKMKSFGSNASEGLMSSDLAGLEEGESIAPPKKFKVINQEHATPKIKRDLRVNEDGTFTDKNTGEILDSKGQPIIEYNGKPVNKDSPFFLKNRKEKAGPLNIIKNETGSIKFGNSDPRTKLTAGPKGESARTFLRNLKSRIKRLSSGDGRTDADIPANAQQFFDDTLAPHRIKTIIEEIDNTIKQFETGYSTDRVPGQVAELQSMKDWATKYKEILNDPSIPNRKKYFDTLNDILDFNID